MATRKQHIEMLLLAVDAMDDEEVESFVMGAQQVVRHRKVATKEDRKKPSLRLIVGGDPLIIGNLDATRNHASGHI